jgi:mannose-6-phosphate isomerase-like protein (cupin superfamily)
MTSFGSRAIEESEFREGPPMDDRLVEPLVLDESDAQADGWDDPLKGRIRWRTLFSKGGTPTDGITCGVADLGPGDWLGLHRHAPPEIYYVFAGAGVVTLDGRETAVRAGTAVFIPAMAEHGITQTGTELLRFFYGFPVNSFDSVEYLFSAAKPA